jgi:hypothetical protein
MFTLFQSPHQHFPSLMSYIKLSPIDLQDDYQPGQEKPFSDGRCGRWKIAFSLSLFVALLEGTLLGYLRFAPHSLPYGSSVPITKSPVPQCKDY